MEGVFPENQYQLPAYRKAMEIFRISRAVAAYFSEDKHVIEMNLSSNPGHRSAGHLVTESLQLAPGIASAVNASTADTRLKNIKKLRCAVNNLRQHCRKLEFSGVKEVEFIGLLRREIQLFDQLMSDWFSYYSK